MKKEHLHNKVIREMIAQVASGVYAPGDRLPAERILCQQLGVSRGTLRKALEALEEMGIVAIKPNSGVYVRGLTQAKVPQRFLPPDFEEVDLRQIVEARKTIELAAVQAACQNARPRQIQKLTKLVNEMAEEVDDISVFLEADLAFHQALVQASGNMVLATAFEAIYEYHRFSSVFSSQREGEQQLALDFHQKLLTALKRRSQRACVRILSEHLDSMLR